jgi:hypothetical protein
MISTGTLSKDMHAARLWHKSPMRQAQTRIDNAISLVSFASEDRGMARKLPGCDGKPPRHPLPASDEPEPTDSY